MSRRGLVSFSKYCRFQYQSGCNSSLIHLNTNLNHLNSIRKFADSRGKLIIEPGCDVPGEMFESLDAGEWKRRKVAEFGSDYEYPGWRPWEFHRKKDTQATLEDWNITGRSLSVAFVVSCIASYIYYIRKKQKLWMRTDHPEYYANHPMNRKANQTNNENQNENEQSQTEQ